MTATPREVIQRLRELQDLDRRIADLDRDVSGGPRAVEAFARAVAAVDAKIASLEERTKLLRAQAKLRENEAKTAQGRVDRLNEQARTVSTNKEFTAIRSEIANAKLDVSRLEDEILKIMEAVEQHEGLLAAANEERAKEQKRLDGERAKVEAGLDGLRRERARLAESRPTLTKDVPAEALAAYDRVLRARGNAVVPVEVDYCSGCNERLTRNDVYCVQNASRIVQCKSCARILYWDAV
jgi:predicted  nucleic acid-binding Zn-ribbon protein